ncbi:putative membrane protein [Aeromicrobium marinum DSM 15272]|uniref:Membrane protein n=1 Tax=Aeromicrobium marinum DSM 15272 TaxID=585531 RepID=E2SF39_9ACTN|nr:EamA family transporter [Aeromicrobium marinum]EFQ82124.1 putative membrane protein [Aeromicrobium marinum DSM 15272]
MAVALALLSAVAYGVSDFLGGVFSRRVSVWQVAVVGQSSSTVCVLVLTLFVDGEPVARDFGFAALAGLATGLGTAFLYRGLSRGRMGVVAPVSAIGTALVPLAVGLVQGDRPELLAALGVALAFPAIWLIAKETAGFEDDRAGFVDGVLAGVGFGGLFALLGQVPEEAGLAPLALTQACSIVSVVLIAVTLRQRWVPRDRRAWWAVLMGPLGATATAAFLAATYSGLLSVTSVIASLYPASTVLLATLVLKERIHAVQGVGLAFAALAVTCVALA